MLAHKVPLFFGKLILFFRRIAQLLCESRHDQGARFAKSLLQRQDDRDGAANDSAN